MEIKLIGTDVDGTLTDAGMYYTIDGDVMKKFNTHDGMGLKLCQAAGIKTAILTSENTQIVAKRAEKLKIDYLFQGMKCKLEVIKKRKRFEYQHSSLIYRFWFSLQQ